GKYLRYDELTSDTSNQQQYGGKPDVIIIGSGIQLIYDNAKNPGLTWTHYNILLKEDAGWRLNNLNGPVPTQAQFRSALANVTSLRIRGEYRTQEDEGGLDNVVLESLFRFDLDGDNSSGAYQSDFLADTTCNAYGLLTDLDAVLQSEAPIDSIVIRILNPGATDELRLDALVGNIIFQQPSPSEFVFLNDGTTLPADFLQGLHLIVYFDHGLIPQRGTRRIEIRVFWGCGQAGIATAFLPIYPPPNAGADADTLLCAGNAALDLFPLLGPAAEPGGVWAPVLAGSAGLFDPARDAAGIYRYFFPTVGNCPGDTASIAVGIEQPFRLRADTTICFDDTLQVIVPESLISWQWSIGSNARVLTVDAPGTYTLSGHTATCVFQDSVQVKFYTCHPCPFYAPNVFSPNDDGANDGWFIQLPCFPLEYHLQVFDRWGSLIFEASDPQTAWDGRCQGKEAVPGVYFWQLAWMGELLGKQQLFRQKGDVTVLR
ncbi:MAG: gliding motility-associated C-terminal domain-containing protein, partial [Saprospiraceae bacterium]